MLIIRRYIYLEILTRALWIAALLLVVVMTNKLVDYLADAASGRIPGSFVFSFLWLKMLAVQPEVLPLVLFLAVTLAFSRLNQDNELAVLGAAGIGKPAQLRLVARFALVFCALAAIVSFAAAPWAKARIAGLKALAWQEANISGIVPGKFKELRGGDSVVYVESLSSDKRVMENVFFQSLRQDSNSVLKAKSARLEVDPKTGNRFIVFEHGQRYLGQPGALDFRITSYEQYAVLVESATGQQAALDSAENLGTLMLLDGGQSARLAELQWRFSSVLACLLLALLGVLLNQYPFGQKPFTLMLLGVLVYFVYQNLLGISRSLMEKDKLTPVIGLWWVHVLLLLALAAIYYYPALVQRRSHGSDVQILTAQS